MQLPKEHIHPSWSALLEEEFQSPYFDSLENFVNQEFKNQIIFPPKSKIFEAFKLTSLSNLKTIVLGQDPYHGPKQANGLSFSVENNQKLPPSLKNIFKELVDDLQIENPSSGDLSPWAKSGVLLINSVFTVRKGQAASHKNQGWETFTDAVIGKISDHSENLVFILWGKFAHGKKHLINSEKHLILESHHPSPLSAYRGFFGSKPFSKTNVYLKSKGKEAVNWELE